LNAKGVLHPVIALQGGDGKSQGDSTVGWVIQVGRVNEKWS